MSFRDLIPLPSLRAKLENAHYTNINEVVSTSVCDITRELNLTREETLALAQVTNKNKGTITRTIGDIFAAEEKYGISTSVKQLDKLLIVGIPPFKITEICGESGSGKTQLCMQLAVNVQLKNEGECIYIDTEGSFLPSRIVSIAKSHGVERILNGIHLFRIHSHTELIALVRQLPDILLAYPKIRLIIIDSIAYHFRINVMSNTRARTDLLDRIARELVRIAHVHTLAVVTTNHVTTDGNADNTWMPSLGPAWGYWCKNRLFLYRKRQDRYGYLYKTVVEDQGEERGKAALPVQFCIKEEGITEPEADEIHPAVKLESDLEEELNQRINSTWEELKIEQMEEDEIWK